MILELGGSMVGSVVLLSAGSQNIAVRLQHVRDVGKIPIRQPSEVGNKLGRPPLELGLVYDVPFPDRKLKLAEEFFELDCIHSFGQAAHSFFLCRFANTGGIVGRAQ